MKKTSTSNEPRKPVVMIVAVVMLIMALALVALGIIYVANLGWMMAVIVILSGLSSAGMSLMTIITGNPAWILLDLILPG